MTATNVSYPLQVGLTRGKGNVRGTNIGALTTPIYLYVITPAALAANNIAAAQAITGASNAVINGALASGGVATLDVARSVQMVSSDAGDTTQTVTLTGTDYYGIATVETVSLNGTTIVTSKKAFKTISRAAVSATLTGNLTIGTHDKFGLPYSVASRGYVQTFWDTAFVTTGTFTAAVATNPATATTGDVRGTFWPASASDGTRQLFAYVAAADPDTANGLYGIDQYGG